MQSLEALDSSNQDSDWCIGLDIPAEKVAGDNPVDLCTAVDLVRLEALQI